MITYEIIRVMREGETGKVQVVLHRCDNVPRPATDYEDEKLAVGQWIPTGILRVWVGGVVQNTALAAAVVAANTGSTARPAAQVEVADLVRGETLAIREYACPCACSESASQPCACLLAQLNALIDAEYPTEQVIHAG